uniref:Ethylene-responsive transcription factor RAP2-7 isoform X4 n=1 Tax=Rhizophora mucronata TaxID=61149 RepID=A0A2P2JQU9_RHIMU
MPFQHIGRSDVFSGPLKGRSPIIVAIEFSILEFLLGTP